MSSVISGILINGCRYLMMSTLTWSMKQKIPHLLLLPSKTNELPNSVSNALRIISLSKRSFPPTGQDQLKFDVHILKLMQSHQPGKNFRAQ